MDYSEAERCSLKEDAFDVRVEEGWVTFTMKTHCPTPEQAREFVEGYILSWELDALLRRDPGAFKLQFDRAEVEDRSPSPGVVSLGPITIRSGVPRVRAQLQVSPPGYPQPPGTPLGHDADVERMVQRYVRYREGRGLLPDTANFCLTVLEHLAGGRNEASKRYGIAKPVLGKVGELCDAKGGDDARKGKGTSQDLAQLEEQFLEAAVKAMIRRAAEFVHDPTLSFQQLTSSDFPSV